MTIVFLNSDVYLFFVDIVILLSCLLFYIISSLLSTFLVYIHKPIKENDNEEVPEKENNDKVSEIKEEIKTSDWAKENVMNFKNTYSLTNSDFKTSDYTQNITREIFCHIADRSLLKQDLIADSEASAPFSDTDSPAVARLYSAGIIKGKSESTFAPNDFITREEAAVILHRMAKYMNLELIDAKPEVYYSDESDISLWALDAVKSMKDMNIMWGVGTAFEPKSTFTAEQAIAVLSRLYK